jgi:CRISPR-associated endonuclease/helicase Cas3
MMTVDTNRAYEVKLEDCWAKLNEDGSPKQNVITHCLLVGHAARIILDEFVNPFLADNVKIDVSVVPIIALHDYGKVHLTFLIKSKSWRENIGSLIIDPVRIGKIEYSLCQNGFRLPQYHHTVVGSYLLSEEVLSKIFPGTGNNMRIRKFLTGILLKHHGYVKHNPRPCQDYGIDLQKCREELTRIMESKFGAIQKINGLSSLFDGFDPCLMDNVSKIINGVTILADWISSGLDWINDGASDEEMIEKIRESMVSKGMIKVYDFMKKPSLTFQEIFPNIATMNKLQKTVDDIEISVSKDRGSVWVIEDQTGSGKTEAALWLIYKFLSLRMSNGFYFGLTSQATSNNIYSRINNFVNSMIGISGNNVKLLHAHASLTDANEEFLLHAKHKFYSTNKKGILYPFSVGTVDQVLLSILNSKHSDLRFLGLINKIIVLDEIHSYDAYTSSLLKDAMKKLSSFGCVLILLSATLTKGAKKDLLGVDVEKDEYPMITRVRI